MLDMPRFGRRGAAARLSVLATAIVVLSSLSVCPVVRCDATSSSDVGDALPSTASRVASAVSASREVREALESLVSQRLLEDITDAGIPLSEANDAVADLLAVRELRTEIRTVRRIVRTSLARGGSFLSPPPERAVYEASSDDGDEGEDGDGGDHGAAGAKKKRVAVNASHWRRSGGRHVPDDELAGSGMATAALAQPAQALAAKLAHLESLDAALTIPLLDRVPVAVDYVMDLLEPADLFELGMFAYKRGVWPMAVHRMKQSLRALARQQGRCAAARDAPAVRYASLNDPSDGEQLYDTSAPREGHLAREPHNYVQFAMYQMGHLGAAASAARAYLAMEPGHRVMEGNLDFYLSEMGSEEDGGDAETPEDPTFDDDDDVLAAIRETEPSRDADARGEGYRDLQEDYKDLFLGLSFCRRQVKELTAAVERESAELTDKMDAEHLSVRPVDRRYNLSYEDFVEQYASRGEPVIIGDGVSLMVPERWTADYIARVCGHVVMTARQYSPTAKSWGRLVDGRTMTIGEFIEEYKKNVTRAEEAEAAGTYPEFGEIPINDLGDPLLYLFDLPLPEVCPEIMTNFSVPRYFAGDLLQRIPRNVSVPYRDSWPSLFVGYKHSRSALHVDSFGSHFWMGLHQGSKMWKFFDPNEKAYLYEDRAHQVFEVDAFSINSTRHPLMKRTVIRECTLRAGEILFVPAGSPHQVRNPEGSIGVSMNYVDATNVGMAVEATGISGEAGFGGQQRLHDQFDHGSFNMRMSKTQRDLPWREFKSWPRDDIDDYTWSPPTHHV